MIAVVFGGYVYWPKEGPVNRGLIGSNLLLMVLLFLLGWGIFGFVVKGP